MKKRKTKNKRFLLRVENICHGQAKGTKRCLCPLLAAPSAPMVRKSNDFLGIPHPANRVGKSSYIVDSILILETAEGCTSRCAGDDTLADGATGAVEGVAVRSDSGVA